MAQTKIVKIEGLLIDSQYPGSADQSSYSGPWADSSLFKHIEVPNGMDADCVEAILVAASADYEGVTLTADSAGESYNGLSIEFDGMMDLDTIVNNFNAMNGSNTISHNGTGTDVLAAGTVLLAGGGIQLQENASLVSTKLQTGRDNKLAELRKQRDEKALEADHELNKHVDSDANAIGLEADWKTYRVALRNITDSYKDGSGNGTSALDTFADDMSDFNAWPVKPS